RIEQLDAATELFRQTVQEEFDLGSLWQRLGSSEQSGDRDLIFQVQGPLLAAPLAWLDFGGKPLFKQVASTSTIVSLTQRHLAEQAADAAGPPAKRILAAQYLTGSDWQRMRGLAHLHADLLQL